jgi:RNA-directed DNA polymerase
MNSDKTNETYRQLNFFEDWDGSVSENIPRDDSTQASIEKSALSDGVNILMEAIVDELNMGIAWARIKANRGAAGPDGIKVKDFPKWFRPQWADVRRQFRSLNPVAALAISASQT